MNKLDLQSKLDHAIAGETILLPVGTYELSKQLTIKEAVILQGTITDKDSTILLQPMIGPVQMEAVSILLVFRQTM